MDIYLSIMGDQEWEICPKRVEFVFQKYAYRSQAGISVVGAFELKCCVLALLGIDIKIQVMTYSFHYHINSST